MALDPTRNPRDVGAVLGRRDAPLTPPEIVQTLVAQRDDPARDPGSTPELEKEIARQQKLAGTMRQVSFNGQVHQFPADATDDEISAALESLAPQGPQASQGDVRKAERTAPLADQDADERAFNAGLEAWLKTPAGQAFTPNLSMSVREAFTKATGRPDPLAKRDQAEIAHARETGDVPYGTSTGYKVAKPLAAIAGFTAGGPIGATTAEAGVRATALISNLSKALEAGAIDEDRASEILWNEMRKGTGEDALFNFGAPLAVSTLTKLALKIPGARGFLDKVIARISQKFTPSAIEGEQNATAVGKRVDVAPDAVTAAAVQDLSGRMGGKIPTPGQVIGEASTWEATARKASPQTFAKQQTALETAAEGMRQDALGINPAGPSLRQDIGQSVLDTMAKTERALKDRLRPTFTAADKLGVSVDLSAVVQRAKAALAEDAAAPAGKLEPREIAELQKIIARIESTGKAAVESQPITSALVDASGKPIVKGATAAQSAVPPVTSPAGTLDSISRLKETMRELPDYKPSKYYETVVGDLTKGMDDAYQAAAKTVPEGSGIAKALLKARNDYREFMGTAYDGATETALKRTPEDVGRVFWQGGNTTEIGQFQKLLNIAQRESALGNSEARENMRRMTLGFLQEAVPNLQAAANWSKTLAESPLKRDTWNALTSTPGGQQLKATMELLEKAATVASRDSSALMAGHTVNLFVQRAAAGGAGYSSVTGAVRPGIMLSAFSLTGITRLAATAYTEGDKGMANLIMRALRANSTATAVSTKVLQQLHDYATKHDVSLDDEEQQ